MKAVVWSDDAADDFDQAIQFIATSDPVAAGLIADRIGISVRSLSGLPAGRPGRVAGTFEKVVSGTPYIVAYAISPDSITVLRLIHGRRNWRAGEWPGG
jgi:plasmid stabilization system protein ParE